MRKYTAIENFRFQKDIQLLIEVEDERMRSNLIPPLLLQPLIENAIQHGFLLKPKQEKNQISIRFSYAQDMIQIEVKDNGIGLLKADENSKRKFLKKESKGLKLVRQRLENLCAMEKATFEKNLTLEDISENRAWIIRDYYHTIHS